MIKKLPLDRGYMMSCATCGSQQEFTVMGWKELMALSKSQGWRQHCRDGTWESSCPTCVKAWAANQVSNRNQKKDPQPALFKSGYPCPKCYVETGKQGVVMYDREKEEKIYIHPECFFGEWHIRRNHA